MLNFAGDSLNRCAQPFLLLEKNSESFDGLFVRMRIPVKLKTGRRQNYQITDIFHRRVWYPRSSYPIPRLQSSQHEHHPYTRAYSLRIVQHVASHIPGAVV